MKPETTLTEDEKVTNASVKELPEFKWQIHSSMAFTDEHALLFRDENFKAQLEIRTPKNDYGEFGTARRFYFLDDDKRTFQSEEELKEALISGPKELWVYAGTTRGAPTGKGDE